MTSLVSSRKSVASCVVLLLVLARLPLAGAAVEPTSPPVVDLHVDLSYRVNYGHGTFANGSGQFVAAELARANVAGVVLPLFIPKDVSPEGPRASDLEASYVRLMSLIPATPPYAKPGCAPAPGRVRTWLSFEGAAPLANEPDAVAQWVSRGARLFGLVHTSDNALATSSGDASPATTGLTDAGREFVRRVYRAGGVVDVSHASDAATDEMIAMALAESVPIVATHSDARAITPHPRNLTDDEIRGIAGSGGVIGINLHSRFLAGKRGAKLADVVRQIEYMVRVAGVEHVAIGSDFEGDIRPPRQLESVRGYPRLAAALRRAGMSVGDVARIFGANALRILCPRDSATVKK